MKKYVLAKDLPDHLAGTPLVQRGGSLNYSVWDEDFTALIYFSCYDLQRAIEQGWVKEVEERVGLMPKNVRISKGLPMAEFIAKNSGELFTPEEINLMIKALSGELMEMVDLREFIKWFFEVSPRVACGGSSHDELLQAFNNREK